MKQIIIFILVLSTLSSIAKDKISNIIVTVEPYMALSYGAFFKSLSLKTSEPGIDYIKGFNFEWGYEYKLKVEARKLENPPMDMGDTEYKLIKIISKQKVAPNYQFKLRLENELYLGPGEENTSCYQKMNDSTYLYLEKINIIIPKGLLIDFQNIIDKNLSKIGVFEFISNDKIRLLKIN